MLTVILAPTDEPRVYYPVTARPADRKEHRNDQPQRGSRYALPKKKPSQPVRIPGFARIEEEAAFWDAHSTMDYEDKFKPVRGRFAKRLSTGVTICLDPDTSKQLRTLAQERGSEPTTLRRMWVLERLKHTESAARR